MAVKFANLASTTLSSAITNSATSIAVADASLFPTLGSGDYFYATIGEGAGSEIVKVTAISSNTLTVTRAQDGTTASAFSSGETIALRVVAAALDDIASQAQSAADTESVSISGDTMTGTLALTDDTAIAWGSGTSRPAIIGNTADDDLDIYILGNSIVNVDASGIDVTGTITATKLIDSDNSNAYVDPNGASVLQGSLLSKGHSSGDNWMPYTDGNFYIRAPITTFDNHVRFSDGNGTLEFSGDSSSNHYLSGDGQIRIRPNGTTINKIVLDASYINAPSYQVGGTTVLTSGRALENITAISSGVITATGNIKSSGVAHPEFELIPTGSVGNADIRFDGTSLDIRSNSSGAYLTLQTATTERLKITNTGNFEFNGGNFSEVGTISSGAITATGASSFTDLAIGGAADSNYDLKVYGLARFQGVANFTNNVQVGGFTVITSARNMQNIGTISSGAITSSGDLKITAGSGQRFIEIASGTTNAKTWRIYNGISWNPDALLIYNHTDDNTALTIEPGKLGVNRGANSLSHTLDVGGTVAISGTQIIDGSRNFANVGTINSSGRHRITGGASGDILIQMGSSTQTQYVDLQMQSNSGVGELFKNGTAFTSYGGASSFNVYNSNGLIAFHPSNTANVLQIDTTGLNVGASRTIRMNGTTVIDASRNITAGSISSGTITSTGNIVGVGINSTSN